MRKWQALVIGGAMLLLLIVGVERYRNCHTGGVTYCESFGMGIGKYGGPSPR
jgi:hypothetical protein